MFLKSGHHFSDRNMLKIKELRAKSDSIEEDFAAAADSRKIRLTVPAEAAGRRLDAYLAGAVADLSRSRAKSLILSGEVAIGAATIVEPKRPVNSGEAVVITLPPPAPAKPAGEAIALDIVYEDGDLIVIDKPAGLVVHPAAGNQTGTLVNALIAHCGASLSGIGGVSRPGIVHRLDKDTTGLMVVAKTDRAHKSLSDQFADHGLTGPLERGYQALVWGAPARFEGSIEAPLGRSSKNREKIEVKREGGRHAVTHYRVAARYGQKGKPPVASLVDCRLETGRTHQIRVHMAAIGHPVIGDRAYGAGFATKPALLPEPARSLAASFPRQALHAYLLGFAHPVTGETLRFERPPPKDMQALADALKSL
jgi:23S rRNA pseudouridine1911/1915/1917 synthase